MRQNISKLGLRILLCLAGMITLFFLAGGIYEAVVYPRTPQKATLAQAVEMDLDDKPAFWGFDEARYVSITDAVWECASVKQSGYSSIFSDKRRTDAVFTDAEKTSVVFIQVDGFYDCEDLKGYQPLGELQRLDTRPIEYQSDTTGKTVIGEDSEVLVYWFCTHCSPSNAVWVPICLVFFPVFIWGYAKYRKRG